jgi:hypothetical protein
VAHSQWRTTTIPLQAGWSAIWLHEDASHLTPDELFADKPEVLDVWRWNASDSVQQFTTSALEPTGGTPDWNYWTRNGTANTLSTMLGQSTYLVRTSQATSFNLTGRSVLPSSTWRRSNANFIGFPVPESPSPTMGSFFATFSTAIATGSSVYKYVGGNLGVSNPIQVFTPSVETMSRSRAYAFSAAVTGNFYGPFSVSFRDGDTLFGKSRNTSTLLLTNRSISQTLSLTLTPETSATAPAGQTVVAGAVPLVVRSFDNTTGLYTDTPFLSALTISIPPSTTKELSLRVVRTSFVADAFYAALLKIRDSQNLAEIHIPVTAVGGSLGGLWIGDVEINGVSSLAAGSSGTAVGSLKPKLRTLLHLPGESGGSLLSQAFIGRLKNSDSVGVATRENLLDSTALSSASRFSAAHLPLDRVINATGSAAPGSSLTATIPVAFDDRTSPFVHQYHPDHDNRSPTGSALSAGVESHSISRLVTYSFTVAPPNSTEGSDWGADTIGGTYREVITGLRADPITVTGTFLLQRASEISLLTQ